MKNSKPYDLEERTFKFAREVITLVNALPKNIPNGEIAKQVTRSAGSVGADYIEANEALGKKNFLMKIRICRKEAKESAYWLRLVSCSAETESLREANELMKIFGAILQKSTGQA